MPYKDPIIAKLWQNKYAIKHAEKIKAQDKAWRESHAEYLKTRKKLYYNLNKNRIIKNTVKRNREKRTIDFKSYCEYLFEFIVLRSKNKYEVNLTVNDLISLLEKQHYKCALTNILMTHNLNDLHSISVDRINSNIGYTPNNIQLVCKAINLAKNKHTNQEMIDFITEIRNIPQCHTT